GLVRERARGVVLPLPLVPGVPVATGGLQVVAAADCDPTVCDLLGNLAQARAVYVQAGDEEVHLTAVLVLENSDHIVAQCHRPFSFDFSAKRLDFALTWPRSLCPLGWLSRGFLH